MRPRVAQASAAIPLIGYALLWSEPLSRMLTLRQPLGEGIWTDTTGRLKQLYYGAIILTIVWIIYVLRCPPDIKRNPVLEQYLNEQVSIHDDAALREAAAKAIALFSGERGEDGERSYFANVPEAVSKAVPVNALRNATRTLTVTSSRSTIFKVHYLAQDASNPAWSGGALLLAGAGLLLVLIPSFEVFLLVTWKVLLKSPGPL